MKKNSDIVDSMLDTLAHEPLIKLSKRQLRHFYEMDRLSRNTWRDIFDRLPSGITSDDLYFIEDGDIVILVKKTVCQEASQEM